MITREFNFVKNNKYFSLTRFSTIVYITSEFNFAKKRRKTFFNSILNNSN